MINKVVASFDEAVSDIPSGATIHLGGMHQLPENLTAAVARKGIRDLTVISCALSQPGPSNKNVSYGRGPRLNSPDNPFMVTAGLWSELGMIRKGFTSFSSNMRGDARMPFEALIEAGLAEVEINSQGILAERIRAAKAGIAAFYSTTSAGSPITAHKEVREFDGVTYVLQTALKADFALIRATYADRWGNLFFDQPASFNHTMAGAATVTIVEVDEIVPLGELRPDQIKTPGVFIDRIVKRPLVPLTSWKDAC